MTEIDDEMPDDVTSKNIVTLITCVIKKGDNIYPQLYLEEALVAR